MTMLEHTNAAPNLPVKDLDEARRFYHDVLGLEQVDEEDGEVAVFKTGDTKILVYRSDHAGTNQATAMTWFAGDVDAAVKELRGKGVRFEHYDLPDTRREGDVHVAGGTRVAWFKDPAGNILAVVNE